MHVRKKFPFFCSPLSENRCFIHQNLVYVFGSNAFSELGLGHRSVVSTPIIQDFLTKKGVKKIDFGDSHSIAITKEYRVYACGSNKYGQLGSVSRYNSQRFDVFKMIKALELYRIIDISAGFLHSLFKRDDGVIYSCGTSVEGATGLANEGFGVKSIPQIVSFPKNVKIIEMCAGFNFSIFISNEGVLFHTGKICSYLEHIRSYVPVAYKTELNFVSISAGKYHIICLSNDGKVYSLGSNVSGKCGVEVVGDVLEMTHVKSIKERIVQITCGEFHTYVINENKMMYVFGNTSKGALGYVPESSNENYTVSKTIQIHCNRLPVMIQRTGIVEACGSCKSGFFIDIFGQVYICGDNSKSKLGMKYNGNDFIKIWQKNTSIPLLQLISSKIPIKLLQIAREKKSFVDIVIKFCE